MTPRRRSRGTVDEQQTGHRVIQDIITEGCVGSAGLCAVADTAELSLKVKINLKRKKKSRTEDDSCRSVGVGCSGTCSQREDLRTMSV